jgi:hypothetical protein
MGNVIQEWFSPRLCRSAVQSQIRVSVPPETALCNPTGYVTTPSRNDQRTRDPGRMEQTSVVRQRKLFIFKQLTSIPGLLNCEAIAKSKPQFGRAKLKGKPGPWGENNRESCRANDRCPGARANALRARRQDAPSPRCASGTASSLTRRANTIPRWRVGLTFPRWRVGLTPSLARASG